MSPTYATKDDDNWNLLGYPYPSFVSLYQFLTTNINLGGFVKIWKHGLVPSQSNPNPFYNTYAYNYDSNDYTTYNLVGSSAGSLFVLTGVLFTLGGVLFVSTDALFISAGVLFILAGPLFISK